VGPLYLAILVARLVSLNLTVPAADPPAATAQRGALP
jgi:hypothetical protein